MAQTIKEAGSPKSTGQSSRLEIHARDNAMVLLGQANRLKVQAGSLCCGLETESLLLWETSVSALKALEMIERGHSHYGDNLLYLKLLIVNVNHYV